MSTQYKRTDWVQRLGRLLLAWLLAGFISSLAYAVPMTTNYQGYLENTEGEPLNATVNMTFALYNTAQGGNALWTETHQQIEITDGVFSLILGNTTPFDEKSLADERYLGVTVGSDPEMAPRQQLTSAFFAMRAAVAESVKAATVETEAIADGAVTAEKIAPQTITGDKIADLSGHNVTELDDVADAGSGKIITAEEREKLESLTSGSGSGGSPTFSNVIVEDQLNVKKRIKVGENSLYLGSNTSGTAGTDNEIWTDGGPLLIQQNSYEKVGIGMDYEILPQTRLEVWDTIKVSSTSAKNQFGGNEGLFMHYDAGKEQGEILAHTSPGSSSGKYVELQIAGNPVVINNSEKKPNVIDPPDYNVGIGTTTPKNKLDITASVAIGSAYAGIKTAPANGLLVEGNVGIGTTYPKAKLHVDGGLRAKKGDTNGDGSNVGYAFDGDGDTGMFAVGGEFIQNSDLYFKIDHQTRLVVRDNGNIGIGTTTPSCKLDVHGNTCLGSNDYLKIGPWKMYQTGGGNVTSYLYIGRTTDMLVRIDWNGRMRAKEFTKWSDERWKTDIAPLEGSLDKISKLQGITYKWDIENNPDIRFDNETHIGFTAQNVEQVLPELVSTDEDGYKSMSYDDMTAVLVEAVKELKAQNDALKAIVCEDHPEKAICQ